MAHIALVVDDYDKAIDFYTKKLDFRLLEDRMLSDEKSCKGLATKKSVKEFEEKHCMAK